MRKKKNTSQIQIDFKPLYSFRYAFKNEWEEWLQLRNSSDLSPNLSSLPVLFQIHILQIHSAIESQKHFLWYG